MTQDSKLTEQQLAKSIRVETFSGLLFKILVKRQPTPFFFLNILWLNNRRTERSDHLGSICTGFFCCFGFSNSLLPASLFYASSVFCSDLNTFSLVHLNKSGTFGEFKSYSDELVGLEELCITAF